MSLEPLTSLTALAIAKLALGEFVKSGAGEIAKQSIGSVIDLVKNLRNKIESKLKGNERAEKALAEVKEHGTTQALDKFAKHLDLEMNEDDDFATEIRQIAQQVTNIYTQNKSTSSYINNGRDQFHIENMQGNFCITPQEKILTINENFNEIREFLKNFVLWLNGSLELEEYFVNRIKYFWDSFDFIHKSYKDRITKYLEILNNASVTKISVREALLQQINYDFRNTFETRTNLVAEINAHYGSLLKPGKLPKGLSSELVFMFLLSIKEYFELNLYIDGYERKDNIQAMFVDVAYNNFFIQGGSMDNNLEAKYFSIKQAKKALNLIDRQVLNNYKKVVTNYSNLKEFLIRDNRSPHLPKGKGFM
ncbi:MAG: hypothetical protein HEQ29_17995 [Dolichospermum sp. LBC05a]|nr:hypothetical protein [Dolichospermum sp. OL01]MCO5798563.1 hypothetical protein [Dolichospermum sp. OL03]MCS6279270.1 hypothetical protein [Dolichospermum sp.]QSV59997.1 MAG: hypothetical protein HEQ29_17995 [Dolichospermum sp. LBC05a]